MEINYDKLVREWSNRLNGRNPIFTNRYHRTVLRDVMKDFGYPLELLDEAKKLKKVPKKDYDILYRIGMDKYTDEIINVYNGIYKESIMKSGGGKTAFKRNSWKSNDLKLYATKFDKPLYVTTAGSVKKVRSPYGVRICQMKVSSSASPSAKYFGQVYALYNFIISMGNKVELKEKLPPGIGYEKMQVDNMVERMTAMFPMSDSLPLQLHIAGQDMGVDINSSIKVPGSPKADLALGQGKTPNFWISYKHGDYVDSNGNELPASYQQYGSLKSFFTKSFTIKAEDAGMEKLINDFLDACKGKATHTVNGVTGIKMVDDKVMLEVNGDFIESPTQNEDIWGKNFTWVQNRLKTIPQTNLHIVDKSGFSYRRSLLDQGKAGEKVTMMSIFGEDYGSGKSGVNNVDVLLQDSKAMDVAVMMNDDIAKGINIEPGSTGHYMLNPELHGTSTKVPKFSQNYLPYLVIRYTGEMNIGWNGGADMFVGARFLINPASQSKKGTDI